MTTQEIAMVDDYKRDFKALYQKRARHYDFTTRLFYLLGFREWAYRKQAVAKLGLRPGQTVVDIGCGTGLNFSLFEEAIGAEGTILGVDMTPAMLDQARARVQTHAWSNVKLIQGDAAAYTFPSGVDAVFASFALTPIPEYEAVIAKAYAALRPGGRMTILELKRPQRIPEWILKPVRWLLKPFGVQPMHESFKPWLAMERQFGSIEIKEFYLGAVYIAVSKKAS